MKPKRLDASLQLDTHVSFIENVCSTHTSYSLMLLFNCYAGCADYIKKLFSMPLTQTVHLSDL